ncbi:YidC/Oxa1 family insertase periplasmic-domain containing protein [Shigella flexneri]
MPLTYTDKAGNVFTKTFTLKRGDYAVNVSYDVKNASENRWKSHLRSAEADAALPTSRDTGWPVYNAHLPWRSVLNV